jgi:hypothetical protein
MNALKGVTGAVLGTLLMSANAEAAVAVFETRAAWEAAVGGPFTETATFPGIPVFTSVNSLTLDGGTSLTFGSAVNKRTIGIGWASWSGGYTGDVFFSNGATSVAAGISPIDAFGLELEPNPQQVITMSLILNDGSVVTQEITQDVDGDAGAKFFGWVGAGIVSFTMSAATDFAFGRFVEAEVDTGTNIPEPGSLLLLIGGLGVLGAAARRRQQGA